MSLRNHPVSASPAMGYTQVPLHREVCVDAENPGSGPHACTASILLIGPHHHSQYCYQRETRKLKELVDQLCGWTFEPKAGHFGIHVFSLTPCSSDVCWHFSYTKLHFPASLDSCGSVMHTSLTQQPPLLSLIHQSRKPILGRRRSFLTRNRELPFMLSPLWQSCSIFISLLLTFSSF